MASSNTQRFYDKSEFTSAGVSGADFNAEIFQVELANASWSGAVPSVSVQGSTVTVLFLYLPTSGDISTLDGLVSAHVGGTLVGNFLTEIDETESAGLDSTTLTQRLELTSGLLASGNYILSWYIEGRTTSVLANSGVFLELQVDLGGGYVARAEESSDLSTYTHLAGSLPVSRNAGQILNAQLMYRRLGGTSNPVFVQRARLALMRIT